MKRARFVAIAAALVLTMTACDDLDLRDLEETFGVKVLSSSPDTEVRKAGDAIDKAPVLIKTKQLRDEFLASGDVSKLDEAYSLNEDDPEINAYRYILVGYPRRNEEVTEKFIESVARSHRLKSDDAAPNPEVKFRAFVHVLEAGARLLVGSTRGKIPSNAHEVRAEVFKSYCDTVKAFETYASDGRGRGTLEDHFARYGDACPKAF